MQVVIEEQAKQEEFRANLVHLTNSFSSSALAHEDISSELHDVNANMVDLRADLRSLLQPVLDGFEARVPGRSHGELDLERVISEIRSTEARTADVEKFFADVWTTYRLDRRKCSRTS